MEFPKIKEDKEAEFKQWFAESNKVYVRFDGFVSRRLLLSQDGNYTAIVEHRSKDTFMKMHKSKERRNLCKAPASYGRRPEAKLL